MTVTGDPSLLVAGIGEMVMSSRLGAHLVAYGLGSCIALAVWDPRTRVAGLAHFMLPTGPANAASRGYQSSGGVRWVSEGSRRRQVPS